MPSIGPSVNSFNTTKVGNSVASHIPKTNQTNMTSVHQNRVRFSQQAQTSGSGDFAVVGITMVTILAAAIILFLFKYVVMVGIMAVMVFFVIKRPDKAKAIGKTSWNVLHKCVVVTGKVLLTIIIGIAKVVAYLGNAVIVGLREGSKKENTTAKYNESKGEFSIVSGLAMLPLGIIKITFKLISAIFYFVLCLFCLSFLCNLFTKDK